MSTSCSAKRPDLPSSNGGATAKAVAPSEVGRPTPQDSKSLAGLPLKDPAQAKDAAEGEPRPGRARKPVGWSMITIIVLVAISVILVYRRDGLAGVVDIVANDPFRRHSAACARGMSARSLHCRDPAT